MLRLMQATNRPIQSHKTTSVNSNRNWQWKNMTENKQ